MAILHQVIVTDKQLTVAEVAYIAGIFDGEGSISLTAYRPKLGWHLSLQVRVVNTSMDLLVWLKETTGCGRINPLRESPGAGWKDCWVWTVRREESRWILPQMLPYLRVKRRQAEIALRFLQIRGDEHHLPKSAMDEMLELCEEIKHLNHRGLREGKSAVAPERVQPADGVCPECGGAVDRRRYSLKQFCTEKCRNAWHNRQREKAPPTGNCAQCGAEFVRYGRKKYCSDQCNKRAFVARQQSTT